MNEVLPNFYQQRTYGKITTNDFSLPFLKKAARLNEFQ